MKATKPKIVSAKRSLAPLEEVVNDKMLIGCQEWCALPKLHVPAIKAKIDTGAKTSALHAFDLKTLHRHGELYLQFLVHPLQKNTEVAISCSALVVDQRYVMNTGGHKELRYVIKTPIVLGQNMWEIEISLTNRDPLAFRMLLGRDALKGHSLIDPGKTFCQSRLTPSRLKALYL